MTKIKEANLKLQSELLPAVLFESRVGLGHQERLLQRHVSEGGRGVNAYYRMPQLQKSMHGCKSICEVHLWQVIEGSRKNAIVASVVHLKSRENRWERGVLFRRLIDGE